MFKTKIGAIRSIDKTVLFEDEIYDDYRNDRDVVQKAINVDSRAFIWSSEDLRGDKMICLQAVRIDPDLIKFASEEIQLLCKDKDPVETLTKAINYDNLKKKLATSSVEQPKPKMKI